MSYQQCSKFWTTVDFDHEYLWNGSSNRQAEKGVRPIDYEFVHIRWKQLGELWRSKEKMTLTFDLDRCSRGFVRLSRYMFMTECH